MGKITGWEHVGIQVTDMDRSIRFYTEDLGLELLERFTKDEEYVQRVVGYHPDVTLEIAMIGIPGGQELEILKYHGVEREPIDPDTGIPGTAHFSLFVDDLGEIYDRLVAKGVEFVSELQTSTAGLHKGKRLVYMKDPDGIRVELVETGSVASAA